MKVIKQIAIFQIIVAILAIALVLDSVLQSYYLSGVEQIWRVHRIRIIVIEIAVFSLILTQLRWKVQCNFQRKIKYWSLLLSACCFIWFGLLFISYHFFWTLFFISHFSLFILSVFISLSMIFLSIFSLLKLPLINDENLLDGKSN